jgi:hypothetical protein
VPYSETRGNLSSPSSRHCSSCVPSRLCPVFAPLCSAWAFGNVLYVVGGGQLSGLSVLIKAVSRWVAIEGRVRILIVPA